ncbi:hypothetical protein [Bdellovibrio sp. HCB-110]|uniref:hypothetical protein n=1 Tax=Bdellovibrio sp. HCB-110 TaxID=3391182 RepID=UPI0039B5C3EA
MFSGASFELDPVNVKWKTTQKEHPGKNATSKDIELQSTIGRITLRKSYWTSYANEVLEGVCTQIHLDSKPTPAPNDVRFRCIIYMDAKSDLTLPHFIEDETTWAASHWLPLRAGGKQLDFYYLEKQKWLVFDAPPGIAIEEFRKLTGTARMLLSYILGVRFDQRSCELALSLDLKTVYEAWWCPGRKRVASGYCPIPSSWGHWASAKEQVSIPQSMRCLDDVVLSTLWGNLLAWPALSVPIEYLLMFPSAPVEMRGAMLSVALESLTSSITEKVKIPTPKPLGVSIWKNYRQILIDYLEAAFKNSLVKRMIHSLEEHGGAWEVSTKKILTNRINDLNKPTNRAKLTAPFHHYGIPTTEQDEKAIGTRNDFLHRGRLLNEKARMENDSWRDVYYTEMRIYTLTNRLLLAALEYEGPMINWGETQLGTGEFQYLYHSKK